MSKENVELVRRGFAHFLETGDFLAEGLTDDFVWDMSKFRGWPERQTYEGVEGAREFIAGWLEAWDDWTLDDLEFYDAGDKVVVTMRQRGRSKTSGLSTEMVFAQVFTMRDGRQARMEMYADLAEAFEAAGLGSEGGKQVG